MNGHAFATKHVSMFPRFAAKERHHSYQVDVFDFVLKLWIIY